MVFDIFFYCMTVTEYYYMAGSVSAKYEQNRDLQLATRAGKMDLPAVSRKKNISESNKINPLLAKIVRSRSLDIGLVLFLRDYGP